MGVARTAQKALITSMKLRSYVVGELAANCYFLTQDKDCIIIDPGDTADFLLEQISMQNLNVKALIATHGHFDHVMAAGEMQVSLGAPFLMDAHDEFLIKRLEETAHHFLGYTPAILKPKVITPITQDAIDQTGFKLTLIPTPGHTPGSICLYSEMQRFVLTGDTVFSDAVGRYDFSYSDKKQLFDSIRTRICTLPKDTLVYSGHGAVTSVGQLSSVYA